MLLIAFPIVKTNNLEIIYWVIEFFFFVDFVLNWFQSYRDPKTQEPACCFKKIAMNYLKNRFVIDFISIIPFSILDQNSSEGHLTKLLRFPRMIRLVKILNENDIKRIIKSL